MEFGSTGVSKLRYASCLAAALGYILLGQHDAVGLTVVDSTLRRHVPPRATAEHLAGIFSAMEETEARGTTALGTVLHRLAERAHPRSLCLVLSDLLDDPEKILAGLTHLRHCQSEVIVFHILDPAEVELPFTSWMIFRDPENPEVEMRLDARQVREMYRENLKEHGDQLRKGCTAAAIDYVPVETREPFETSLAGYLQARSRYR